MVSVVTVLYFLQIFSLLYLLAVQKIYTTVNDKIEEENKAVPYNRPWGQ
jgi:hypothetical protein